MKHRSSTRRMKDMNTPLDWKFGITQQGLLHMELPLEILCHKLASEQPRESSHVPSASMPSTTRQTQRRPLLLMISTTSPGLYSVYGPATMVRLFSFHCIPSRSMEFVMSSQNSSQVIQCTSRREQIDRSAQVVKHPTFTFRCLTRCATTPLLGFAIVRGKSEADSFRFPESINQHLVQHVWSVHTLLTGTTSIQKIRGSWITWQIFLPLRSQDSR